MYHRTAVRKSMEEKEKKSEFMFCRQLKGKES